MQYLYSKSTKGFYLDTDNYPADAVPWTSDERAEFFRNQSSGMELNIANDGTKQYSQRKVVVDLDSAKKAKIDDLKRQFLEKQLQLQIAAVNAATTVADINAVVL